MSLKFEKTSILEGSGVSCTFTCGDDKSIVSVCPASLEDLPTEVAEHIGSLIVEKAETTSGKSIEVSDYQGPVVRLFQDGNVPLHGVHRKRNVRLQEDGNELRVGVPTCGAHDTR